MRRYKVEHPADSPEQTMAYEEIIKNKKFLRRIYEEWYALLLNTFRGDLPKGAMIELGSGGGFFKEVEPRVICSDILTLPSNDVTFSALDMPFSDHSVAGMFMIDTLHHIPDCERMLREASRVLASGGKMVMIEPANSAWGRFIYRNFHHETFDPTAGWSIPEAGPLSGANGALPWIIFVRDRELFKTRFPHLHIDAIEYLNPLTYLLSGGVSRAAFLPYMAFPAARMLDKFLLRLSWQTAMFMLVKITRG